MVSQPVHAWIPIEGDKNNGGYLYNQQTTIFLDVWVTNSAEIAWSILADWVALVKTQK